MPSAPSIPPPPVGTLIDNGSLVLTDILGYGGYGVVYRALDAAAAARGARSPAQYAVKCLTHAQAERQLKLHMREISLHRLSSAHRGVVSVFRVVSDNDFTFIVMDYCPDGDLFTQILHNRTYLGYDRLIKHVFLQLLDAVEHCHSLGIYHRDLKPENILCTDGGLRVKITDFGLATTEKLSSEFRTGSVYHMSPECQGGRFAQDGKYSPERNDTWSLGIILINLATGRNPWKSATLSDPTFYAYLQDRPRFLPTVLPISERLNALLVRTLEPDYTRRISLRELRAAVQDLDDLYAPDCVFQDSMAKLPWECRAESDSGSEAPECATPPEPAAEPATAVAEPAKRTPTPAVSASVWSEDGEDDAAMAGGSADVHSWIDFDGAAAVAAAEPTLAPTASPATSLYLHSDDLVAYEDAHAPTSPPLSAQSTDAWIDADGDRSMSPSPSPSRAAAALASTSSSGSSSSGASSAHGRWGAHSLPPTPRAFAATPALVLDTELLAPDADMYSAVSSAMHTAVDSWADDEGTAGCAPWAASFFLPPSKASLPPHSPAGAAVPMAVDFAITDSGSSLGEPVPRRRAPARASDAGSAASAGHDADVESLGPSTRAPSPRGSLGAASSGFFARYLFAAGAPAAAAAPTPASPTPTPEPAPHAGPQRPGRARRRSSRFNPLKAALRSLSPRARTSQAASAPSSSAAPSRAATPSEPARAPGSGAAATAAEEKALSSERRAFASALAHGRAGGSAAGLRLRPARRGWRLFGSAACVS